MNTLCIAGTYHSGWFVHPSARERRAYFTEGSVCYFRPQASLYRETALKPVVSHLCEQTDWLAEAGDRLDKYRLRLVSWTIGTHNTRLGLAHPHLTQQTVYGDRLPHVLCPSNSDVRIYLMALCRDLATNYPMWGLQLESFGWMTFAHGHHHERDLVGLAPLEQELLSLCFCPACKRLAGAAGVDVGAAAGAARSVLDAAFREAPARPAGHPVSIDKMHERSRDLEHFNDWRKRYSDSVIAELKAQAMKGTECRLLLQTAFDPALREVADGFACGAYGSVPPEVTAICREARAAVPQGWEGLLQCFIRLGNGVPQSEEQLRQIIAAVCDGGCNGINFYNRSEAPPKMLEWLARVMPEVTAEESARVVA